MHHLSRIGSGEVVADVAVPLQAEGQGSPKYQVSQVKLGKQMMWGELDTLELATNIIKGRMEKEYTSHVEVKAHLEQYKKLLVEMGKSLDTCKNDNLPSTSSLLEGDMKALLEVRPVAATTKSWVQINASKITLFLQKP